MAEKVKTVKPLSTLVQTGDILAEVNYVKMTSREFNIPGLHVRKQVGIVVQDLRSGLEYAVRGADLIDQYQTADHYDSEQEVTRTELARLLVDAGILPFTVVYSKADKTIRTLRGHLVSHETYMGRSTVVDLDITSGSPLRQVDHRTLKSLVIGRVKYIVKGEVIAWQRVNQSLQ